MNGDPTGALEGSLDSAISMLELTMGYLLSGDGLYTVFVPTDLAFQQVEYEVRPNPSSPAHTQAVFLSPFKTPHGQLPDLETSSVPVIELLDVIYALNKLPFPCPNSNP